MESFLPILGVFLGWTLSTASTIMKDKKENKKEVKKYLYLLMNLRVDILKTLRILRIELEEANERRKKDFKNVDYSKIEIFQNKIKQHITSKHIEEFCNEIETISSIDPISAYNLSGLYYKYSELTEIVKTDIKLPQDYTNTLLFKMTGLIEFEMFVEFHLKRVAQMISWRYYFSIKSFIKEITEETLDEPFPKSFDRDKKYVKDTLQAK